MQISLYFFAFALLVGLYTFIFHSYYPVLENKTISWMESLLFVVESITTVGYGELLPFSADLTRLLAIEIMITGVIMIFVVIPLLIAPYLSTLLAPSPPRRTPHALSRHVVVFGYDELTRSVVESMAISDHDIVIIEQDKSVALEIATRYRKRAYVIWGDYTDPDTWSGSHLAHADHIVISKDERLTANIILSIRELAKGKIIAVVDKLSFDRYLRYAGAEDVLSPKHSTGKILASHAVLNMNGDAFPEIPGFDRIGINFQHTPEDELRLINIPVFPGCKAEGKTLRDIELFGRYGIVVLFLWKAGTFIAHPSADDVIDRTTSLFIFGRGGAILAAIRDEFEACRRTGSLAVIAGFGDVGLAAYQDLNSAGVSCVVVDLIPHNVSEVIGNAEDEHVLQQAQIEKAQFCVVALNDDDVNIFTTLMVRNLNPDIRILARANSPASTDKLYRAGADYVALLPSIGGQTIAKIILADIVTILLDLPNGDMVIMKRVTRSGHGTVSWFARRTGVRIIGIESINRSIVTPEPQEILSEGDLVIAVGNNEQLKKFIHQL
jgi:voltage-gated potassium channel